MKESNYQIFLSKSDISYTEHKTGEAEQTKVFGIDWNRLFGKYNLGGLNTLPSEPFADNSTFQGSTSFVGGVNGNSNVVSQITNIVGLSTNTNKIENFALHDLISKNPGYDMIMFPQFEVQKQWFLIGSKSKVIVKARMAKITPDKL
jgi:hypothetical protein